jgi:hypothetical protein
VRTVVILWLALGLAPAWGQLKEREDTVVPRSPSGGLLDEDEDIVQDTTWVPSRRHSKMMRTCFGA